MKVRQSVSVTSELGDPNNLALFNGESSGNPSSSLNFWFGSSTIFNSIKVNCFQSAFLTQTLSTFTPLHMNQKIHTNHAHTLCPTDYHHPPTSTHNERLVSAQHAHTHSSPALENALLQQINPHFASYQFTKGVSALCE